MGGKYLDQVNGCTQCGEGTYSPGGTISLCSNCPAGKTVAPGHGSSESDCSWSKSGDKIKSTHHILSCVTINSE